MRILVLFVCLSVGCLAQRPKPCTSPPLLSGSLSVSTQSEKLMGYAKYNYDALGKRIRLTECGSYNNKTFHFDALLLYRQGVMYKINYRNRTCCKRPLRADFHPLAIPSNASLLGQVVLGSSSGPRQGLLVNTWGGSLQTKKGPARYMSTVTEFGCVPVTTLFHTSGSGWVVTKSSSTESAKLFYSSPEQIIQTLAQDRAIRINHRSSLTRMAYERSFSFFNNVIGITDPGKLIPPPFCKAAKLEKKDCWDPVSFFNFY